MNELATVKLFQGMAVVSPLTFLVIMLSLGITDEQQYEKRKMSINQDRTKSGRFKSKGLGMKSGKPRQYKIAFGEELEEILQKLPKGTMSERVRQWVREGMEREGLL